MQTLLPLALFAFVSSITPGPNNIMLTSSGITFGFTRTVPHLLGISFGVCALLALCAAGIGELVLALPSAQMMLKIAGSGYLLYLAWKLRLMALDQKQNIRTKPMSFAEAALFQFANPKAWVMAVTGVSGFLPSTQPAAATIGLFCLVFCMVNLPCTSVWAGTGAILGRHLEQPLWRRIFTVVMVALTIYSAAAMWF